MRERHRSRPALQRQCITLCRSKAKPTAEPEIIAAFRRVLSGGGTTRVAESPLKPTVCARICATVEPAAEAEERGGGVWGQG